MSPILVRPVREQLEHDRIIRLLQVKHRRKYDVGINPGAEQNVPAGTGDNVRYPDLVLTSQERSRRVEAVVEVETGESVNYLEALAEWTHFSKLPAPFHLYVPATMVDVARRLCDDHGIVVSETWSYIGIGDDVRFTLVHRNRDAAPAPAARRAVKAVKKAAPPVRRKKARPAPSRSTSARPARAKAPVRKKKVVAKKTTKTPATKTAAKTQKRK
ncbi:MAG: hypothetical protein LBQ09_03495 [Acidobacteriaceae bacterium]|nr:hypothetical protein [Acidobacteriaceae bacterium]